MQILLRKLVVLLQVNLPVDCNRVYLTGYSCGGDGVYQLSPRLADYLAGGCMMAGHPNDASPLNLRNIAFSMHCGELD
jgi:poly(3-hydroxybutyrate) depolymerase